MTEEEKNTVRSLREQGYGYKTISNITGAIKEIRFFPENVIRAEMIDGSVQEMALNPCWPEKERKRKKNR